MPESVLSIIVERWRQFTHQIAEPGKQDYTNAELIVGALLLLAEGLDVIDSRLDRIADLAERIALTLEERTDHDGR